MVSDRSQVLSWWISRTGSSSGGSVALALSSQESPASFAENTEFISMGLWVRDTVVATGAEGYFTAPHGGKGKMGRL